MSIAAIGSDPDRLRRRRRWVVLLGAALAVRVAAAIWLGGFAHPELFEQEQIARSLVEGRGYVLYRYEGTPVYAYTSPLYPWVCALVYRVTGGDVAAGIAVQIVLSVLTVWLAARLAGQLWGRRAGWLAGALVACHPGLIVYASLKAHPLSLDALCVLLVVWQLIRLRDRRTAWQSAIAGGLLGLTVLSRATFALLVPVALAWLAWIWRPVSRRAIGHLALVGGCAALMVLPWVARNYGRTGEVALATTNWESFWRGNNPAATGGSYITADQTVLRTIPAQELEALGRLPNEVAVAHWFRDRALHFIREHPGQFLRLTAVKFWHFWWFAPQSGLLYAAAWLRLYQAFYVLVLCAAATGVWWVIRSGDARQRHAVGLLAACALMVSIGQSLYYVEGRHRWSLEPLLLLLAGAGASYLMGLLMRRPLRAFPENDRSGGEHVYAAGRSAGHC